MKIKSTRLPGIGQKISIITAENNMIVIIVHHTGKRSLYFFEEAGDDQPDSSITLNADETREIGAQLLGAVYQPANANLLKMFHHQINIEWTELAKESELAYKTIAESRVGELTGAAIVGLVKGEDVIASPDSDEVLRPGDTIISIGKQEQNDQLVVMCNGEEEL
ncbi:cation:proton antiporter regulatory subunit [Tuberibacillus sp. Marseille-P3662]|uniref:cation:proton antiporter regulatory subunit n=1 Tax=Tuberibacillus sp. Marseille-P3662 TaxID=1965358 RepID=UPI000A1CEBFD|nr:TrkA C-terminal domain-containing protein [Tuberibacillus sp. Marseille-P3662]